MIRFTGLLFALAIFLIMLSIIACGTTSGPGYVGQGQTFDILAYPEGIGTLLFFYKPLESISEEIKFDVALLNESYGEKLRIVFIDTDRKQELVFRHQIREIPTLILFNRVGTELHRWLPHDFKVAFSKKDMQRVIDRLLLK